jgi:prepilin-type N-terminal cleavage/methylation domain-containing protein
MISRTHRTLRRALARMPHAEPLGGFTLIEMLVVLAILAALSLVALRSTAGLADRGRFEATQRALDAIEDAIVGPQVGLQPNVATSGFLADCGRLPNFTNADSTKRLFELWQLPANMVPNHLVPDLDPEVVLACGWRGPYLRLPTGANADATDQVLDGFAHPIAVQQDAAMRWQIVSPGADGLFDQGTDYDADVALTLPVGVEQVALSCTLTVTGSPTTATWTAQIFAFQPDPITGQLKAVHSNPMTPSGDAPYTFQWDASTLPSADALTPGPRAFRAYVFTHAQGTRDNPLKASRVYNVTLLHGAQVLELTID